jgi:hypothetical protein
MQVRASSANATREKKTMRMPGRGRFAVAAVSAVAALGLLGGCSSDTTTTSEPSGPETTSAVSAGCADAAVLKSSLDALTEVKPAEDGLDALQTAIADVQTNLESAVDTVSSTLEPQVKEVEQAFTALQESVNGLTADNLAQKAPAITSALKDLGDATSALATTLTQDCPDN